MSKRRYLTPDEVRCLLAATLTQRHGHRDYCMILMGFLHGLRATELLSLQLSDIDLQSRIVHIQRLKNGFSTTQPLLNEEIKALRLWLKERKTWKPDSDQVFISQRGAGLSRQQFYNIMISLGKKAEFSFSPHPHMLRHACGFALADNGIDTRLIQDYLGHRNIRHTVLYTASNAARFEDIWRVGYRRRRRHLVPKCLLLTSSPYSVGTKIFFIQ